MNNNSMVPPSALSVPQVSIASSPRPGKRGPAGTSPPQNTSMVNTGIPQNSQVGLDSKQTPPASMGMLPQKSALPVPQVPPQKSEVKMGSQVARPTVQEMIKAAMAGSASRLDVSREASRQAENLGEKTASEQCSKCDKDPCECKASKTASYNQAMQLADAVEYIADAFSKEANITPGEGPGALTLSESPSGTQPNQPTGKVTADSGMETPSKLKTTINEPAGGGGTQELSISGGKGKVASVKERASAAIAAAKAHGGKAVEKVKEVGRSAKELASTNAFQSGAGIGAGTGLAVGGAAMHVGHKMDEKKKAKEASAPLDLADAMKAHMSKAAEDAISPAKISAGAAVPPDTSASGESGGAPVGGQPEGATALVGSVERAINYTKGQAKAKVRADMRPYVTETALKDDGALAAAFSHSGEAGTKMSSVQGSIKTAAARALLSKLAEAASQE